MSKRSRILIVSSGNPCRNPRPVKEATALSRAGFDVTLLSPAGQTELSAIDQQLSNEGGFTHLTVPEPRMFSARVLQWLARRAVPFGLETTLALGGSAALLARARSLPSDLVIVHNEVPHHIGVQLIRERRRVVADIEDWHSEDLLLEERRHRPLKLLRETERFLLHHAIHTTTTSQVLADALHTRYGGKKPHVVTNSFPLQPVAARVPSGNPPSFFWFSQTLGPGRGIEHFLRAWVRTRQPSRVVLLGEPRPDYVAELLSTLPNDFRSRISFRPLVSPAELPAVIAAHDIGLALEESLIPSRDLTITNKILQYLNAGLAVVASDTAGQREVLARDPTAGVVVQLQDTAAFARSLDDLVMDPVSLASRQCAARNLAEKHFCWEIEEPRLLSLVATALAIDRRNDP